MKEFMTFIKKTFLRPQMLLILSLSCDNLIWNTLYLHLPENGMEDIEHTWASSEDHILISTKNFKQNS